MENSGQQDFVVPPLMAASTKKTNRSTNVTTDCKLLETFHVNADFVIGVYQGTLSEFDIIIKYRQRLNGKWTKERQPKHIHWAVDLLLKMQEDKNGTIEFINHLLQIWENTTPLKSHEDRDRFLAEVKADATFPQSLSRLEGKGEYSVAFLHKLGRLLMAQEKSNNANAFMFKHLLTKLLKTNEIYAVVSAASFGKR